MAVDSWVPHRFAALSERLTTQNGIVLMGARVARRAALHARRRRAAGRHVQHQRVPDLLALDVRHGALVLLDSAARRGSGSAGSRCSSVGFLLCATILAITASRSSREGGWITLAVTGALVALCFVIRGALPHRRRQARASSIDQLGSLPPWTSTGCRPSRTRRKPTAVVLVGSYGGLGIHTVLNAFRAFPGHFKNLVFVSVGVIDSGEFKGEDDVRGAARAHRGDARRATCSSRAASGSRPPTATAIGTDAVEEAEQLCRQVAAEFHGCTFFAGKVIFQREQWYQRCCTTRRRYAIQKRLQWAGQTMVILPAKLR